MSITRAHYDNNFNAHFENYLKEKVTKSVDAYRQFKWCKGRLHFAVQDFRRLSLLQGTESFFLLGRDEKPRSHILYDLPSLTRMVHYCHEYGSRTATNGCRTMPRALDRELLTCIPEQINRASVNLNERIIKTEKMGLAIVRISSPHRQNIG